MDSWMENSPCVPRHQPIEPELLAKILRNCTNPKLLSIAKQHINTLLKYAEDVEEAGSAAFITKEEYQKFAIAKFFVDKCIDSLKANSTNKEKEIEEGEIGSDIEDQQQKSEKQRNEKIPPLEAFHLSPLEKKRRLYEFWKDVKAGEIYNAKVIDVNDDKDVYELLIINKYLNNERLIDLTINACMKKTCIKEDLRISDLVRVSVIGCTKVNSNYKLVMTADLSTVKVKIEKSIQLGKISAAELPFLPVETCKFRSMTHYVTSHGTDRDPKILIQSIKALDIDPYKIYSLHPELDGKKGDVMKNEKNECSKNEYEAAAALKQAMIWKEKGEIQKALTCVNRALELNPKYDIALVIRGSLFVLKCNGKPSRSLLSAVEDFIAALQLNSHSYLALKNISELILQSALKFMDEECFDKSREALECASRLQENKQAEKVLDELSLYQELRKMKNANSNANEVEMNVDP